MSESAAIDSQTEETIKLPSRRSNRPITLAHQIEYGIVRGMFAGFRLMGLKRSSKIAGAFCKTVGPRLKSIQKRGEDNLREIYPDWSQEQIDETLKGVWENLGRMAAEFAHIEKFINAVEDGAVTIVNKERFEKIIQGEDPVIFVSSHSANWELLPVALKSAGVDYGIVYRPANNPLIDELIISERAKAMSRRQIPKGRRGARELVENLKAGRSLAMLVDQKLNDGVEAPFMGRPAMTTPAAARLSLKFNTPLVPVQMKREKDQRYTIVVKEPIAYTPTGDLEADTLALTTLMNKALEEGIRETPDQWLWLHRRWGKMKKS